LVGTHISFHDCGVATGSKTRSWIVQPKDGSAKIGCIKWHGAWRKYCFFTEYPCIFEEVCLREIARFVEARTREHRSARKAQAA
jgi:hypothetical protein